MRQAFNGDVTPRLARAVSASAREVRGPSGRFAYFQSDDDYIVVSGPREAGYVQLALIYALEAAQGRSIKLVLPREYSIQTRMRLPWLSPDVSVYSYAEEELKREDTMTRNEVLKLFPQPYLEEPSHHLGDATEWVEELVEWAAGHPCLMPAHRPEYRAWHCYGLSVLRLKRSPDGVLVEAGITRAGEGGEGTIRLELRGPLGVDPMWEITDVVDAAIDARAYEAGAFYRPDEHWLQAAIRENPVDVGLEHPVTREVPSSRCVRSDEGGAPLFGKSYIDLLAINPHGSLCIIETKLGTDDLMVMQGLDYLIWAEARADALRERFQLAEEAPFELNFLVGSEDGKSMPRISKGTQAQLEALGPDVRWAIKGVTNWFDGIPTVSKIASPKDQSPDSEGMTPLDSARCPSWKDPLLGVAGEPRRTAKYRLLQSWYREERLRISEPGRTRTGRLVGSLLPSGSVGANFLTPEVTKYAIDRTEEVHRAGGAIEPDRLHRNMLASQPLCFNLFGALRGKSEMATLVHEVWGVENRGVTGIECEWAPPPSAHLGDRTAFDAVITYRTTTGTAGIIGIETKYTEPFSQKLYDKPLYRSVTEQSGLFRSGAAEVLKAIPTNQLWRMVMLLATVVRNSSFAEGCAVVMSTADDSRAIRSVEAVRQWLKNPDVLRFTSFESFVEVASRHPSLEGWARAFKARYLDLSVIQ